MRKRYRQCAIWQQISRSYYNIGVFISRNSRKKTGEDAENFLAKKITISLANGGRWLTLTLSTQAGTSPNVLD
ncbi:hypothetical protein GVI60_21720 [Citrobacter freundii]|uniref:Uncharacterized protein n=1 Tax=Citrobacter portucalensis TaxID=1639133 RepID=A0AAW9ET34_9ENTR|nr:MULTISPECIES: hypothetical protein [Citrobacter]UKK34619.1 hypothetical protein GVI60_21720 [Citrobacter freundii]MCQ6309555.1 hypothetical protein [Citrobacter portucalensis]MCS1422030.1 hypothetical protein [Citrobacter portucalensis]MDM2795656.1 hypothetical protein [Citrobacter sp. Cpo114]MDX7149277.1 hypothetical protein [Citrobacter portucalensis]